MCDVFNLNYSNSKASKFFGHIGFDCVSASIAATFVSPTVGAIDRAFTQSAAGTHTMKQALKESFQSMLLNPRKYFTKPDYWLLYIVYTTTYTTANIFDTIFMFENKNGKYKTVNQEMCKLFGVSTVNTLVCLWKDQVFAKLCHPSQVQHAASLPLNLGTNINMQGGGTNAALNIVSVSKFGNNNNQLFNTLRSLFIGIKAPKLPIMTYGIWFIRDMSMMGVSFNLPPYLASYFNNNQNGIIGFKKDNFESKNLMLAQFLGPVLCAPFCGFLHLLGLDIYNNPNSSLKDRYNFISKRVVSSGLIKCVRVIPPFAIGPATNRYVRQYFGMNTYNDE